MWTYFHQMDPFIIQLTDTFGIRWYSMAYIMGFVMSYYIINKWLIKTGCSPVSKNNVMDQITWAVVGVLLGGRLGYAIFYSPELFTGFDSSFPFWDLLKVHHGGMASHGGIIGLMVATILFAKKNKLPSYHCLDITALVAGMGICFGRIANFINGELYGRVITGKTFLAVQFPQEMLAWVSERKIEYLNKLSTAVQTLNNKIDSDTWLDLVEQFASSSSSYVSAQIYSTVHSLISACEQGNQMVISALRDVLLYRHPSQLYQAGLEGLLPFFVLWWIWRKQTLRPGVIAGIWASLYAVMRIIGEQFKTPDTHIGFQALGLTRGQWLSIAMIVLVAVYFVLLFKYQKEYKKWGGWKQKSKSV